MGDTPAAFADVRTLDRAIETILWAEAERRRGRYEPPRNPPASERPVTVRITGEFGTGDEPNHPWYPAVLTYPVPSENATGIDREYGDEEDGWVWVDGLAEVEARGLNDEVLEEGKRYDGIVSASSPRGRIGVRVGVTTDGESIQFISVGSQIALLDEDGYELIDHEHSTEETTYRQIAFSGHVMILNPDMSWSDGGECWVKHANNKVIDSTVLQFCKLEGVRSGSTTVPPAEESVPPEDREDRPLYVTTDRQLGDEYTLPAPVSDGDEITFVSQLTCDPESYESVKTRKTMRGYVTIGGLEYGVEWVQVGSDEVT